MWKWRAGRGIGKGPSTASWTCEDCGGDITQEASLVRILWRVVFGPAPGHECPLNWQEILAAKMRAGAANHEAIKTFLQK